MLSTNCGCGFPVSQHHYGVCPNDPANSPNPTVRPDQVRRTQRSDRSLCGLKTTDYYGLTGKKSNAISIILTGKSRRSSDGALGWMKATLEIDHHGTIRTWIMVPMNPDADGMVGNVFNQQYVHPLGSGWIGACGPVSFTSSDRDWEQLGLLGMVDALLSGRVMADDRGNKWELLAEDWESKLSICEFCQQKVGTDGITPA
jgi:hypothetical protein